MPERKTLAQLIAHHEAAAAYWLAKSIEWRRKSEAAAAKAKALKAQVAEAHGA